MQCGKQEEGRLESPLDAPWLQWCADFQDAARELAEREMTEGKVAFDPTDEVRPDDSRFLFVVQTRLSVVLLSVGAFFFAASVRVSLWRRFMISQALLVFLLRGQVIERFVVAASRLRGAVFSDTRFAKARSEGWVLAAAGPPTAAEADATPWDGEPPKQYGDPVSYTHLTLPTIRLV